MELFKVLMPGPHTQTSGFHWFGTQPGHREFAKLSHAAKAENHCSRVLWGAVPPLRASVPKLTHIFNEDENFYNKRLL